ncbi:MAG: hypothetical protein NZ853_01600 [Leptospiraceae bacterium]|nr:hypothetical protein [Leptospiraceae bacterium]MDW7976077.1 hypothetical protein [Leptospiraceae bacterium]
MIRTLEYINKSIKPISKFKIHNFQKITINEKPCYKFSPIENHKKEKILVVIPGMTVRGIDDPRLLKQCEIFRQLGFITYLPYYPEIHKLEIQPESIDNIVKDLKTIIQIHHEEKIYLMSVSFSGALTLIASSHSEIRDYINSIFLIGSFAHFRTTASFLILNKDVDPYGYFIILKNLLPYIKEYNYPELVEAFYIAAIDDALKTKPPKLEEHLEKYPHIRETFEKLMNDDEERKKIFDSAMNHPEVKNINVKFDVLPYIRFIKAKISILHGKNDSVIPPEESIMIYKECQKYNIPSRITVTSLLDHGNVRLNLNVIAEFFSLIHTLNFFLE